MEKKKLRDLLNEARKRGLCKTQRDFAKLLGVTEVTLSKALSENTEYDCSLLELKAERLIKNAKIQTATGNSAPTTQTIGCDEGVIYALIDEISEERAVTNTLLALLAQQMGVDLGTIKRTFNRTAKVQKKIDICKKILLKIQSV